MDRAFGDKNDIARSHMMSLLTDCDRRFAAQDVLLVLDRVRVARHPASLLHGKFPQGKVGTLLRGNEDLNGRVFSCRDMFRFHIPGMFDRHKLSPRSAAVPGGGY